MKNILSQDQQKLTTVITRDSSASILLEKGIKPLHLFLFKFCDHDNSVICKEN